MSREQPFLEKYNSHGNLCNKNFLYSVIWRVDGGWGRGAGLNLKKLSRGFWNQDAVLSQS